MFICSIPKGSRVSVLSSEQVTFLGLSLKESLSVQFKVTILEDSPAGRTIELSVHFCKKGTMVNSVDFEQYFPFAKISDDWLVSLRDIARAANPDTSLASCLQEKMVKDVQLVVAHRNSVPNIKFPEGGNELVFYLKYGSYVGRAFNYFWSAIDIFPSWDGIFEVTEAEDADTLPGWVKKARFRK